MSVIQKLCLKLAALLALALSITATRAYAQPPPLADPDLTVMNTLRDTYGWGEVFGWPANTNPCPRSGPNWAGVTCTNNNERVESIIADCTIKKLYAPIPPIISQLTALHDFNLRNCGMTGPIPDSFASLTQLTRLRLDGNLLSGPIPPGITTLPDTLTLSLANNRLTGAIPPVRNSFSYLVRLGGNFLTSIPETWTQFSREIIYNCYQSLPSTCDSQSDTNRCTPNRPDCPSTMTIAKVSGDGQRTQTNSVFPNPLVVSVTDGSGNPVTGATVTFSGPGIFTSTEYTNANGLASATVQANSAIGGNTVTASLSPNAMVTFGLTSGSAANCSTNIGVTSTEDSGPGTLRQALADVCPGGTVDLGGIANQTISLSGGAGSYNFGGRLYIAGDVTVEGRGVTISGSGATRIFFVQGGKVTLRNLILTNGLGQGGSSELGGSAAGMGGAIFQNGGVLTLSGVTVSGNRAVGGSPDTSGTQSGGGFGANSTGGDLGGTAGIGDGAGGVSGGIGGFGGFGGGGGTAEVKLLDASYRGGAGGFGGGGGWTGAGLSLRSGYPGYGGGEGNNSGGGGAGFGGAIFVRAGTLNLKGVSFTGNQTAGGTAAQGKGGSLFLYNGVSFNRTSDVTFSGSVAADAGLPGTGYSEEPYVANATCPGADTVHICGKVPSNTLTVSVTGNGSVTDSGGLLDCPGAYCSALYQNSAALIATPAAGQVFNGWSGGGCSGTGTCTVSLAGGNKSVTAEFMELPTAPSITQNPSNVTVTSGSQATFTAAAAGNPAPTVQWQVSTNGGALFTNISSATSTTLSFTASAGQNGNQYRAVFTNSVASVNSAAATLTINGLPSPSACGSGRSMPVGQWTLFSLPCVPSAATVAGVFNGISGTYGTDWVVYEHDEATNQDVKLGLDSVLTQGNGYWFKSVQPATFSVSGTATPVTGGFFEIPLIKPAGINGLYNLAGHPFPNSVDWADVRVVVNGGRAMTPSQAETAAKLSKTFWMWNGNGYDSYDDVTAGMKGQLQATYGMWVKVLDKNVTSIKLLVPAPAGQSALGIIKDGPKPGEWYVRLIAEVPAEGLKDRGNVLGQLKDSKLRPDIHDLPELAPSFTPYLRVVFPGERASDFHPVKSGADGWKFVVRTDNPARQVKLSWEVNGKAPANMSLKDVKTGKIIQRKAGSYTFVMGATERAFTWSVK